MQQLRRIRLGEQPAFEVHARREVVIGVGRPGKAINAAMLTAAIGIDRTVESQVGRTIAGQDGLGVLDRNRRSPRDDAVEAFDAVEPVTVGDPLLQIEACRRRVACCASPGNRFDRHWTIMRPTLEQNKNL